MLDRTSAASTSASEVSVARGWSRNIRTTARIRAIRRNVAQPSSIHINHTADSSSRKIGRSAEAQISIAADDGRGLPSYARRVTHTPRFERKGEGMLNPSRPLVISFVLVALAALVLGLATDVGLFG